MSAAIEPLAPGEELIDAASFAAFWSRVARPESLGSCAPVVLLAPPSAAALEAEIAACANGTDVAHLTAQLGCAYAEAAAVFVVNGGVLHGAACAGGAGSAESVLFPEAAPTVFGEAARSGEVFWGALPGRPLERRILRALGREAAREIAVLPIFLGGRVVSLLYADNGAERIGEGALAALGAAGRCAARAYARLLLQRRRA
jgi:hypothetical protein